MLEIVLPVPFWLELAAALTGGLSGAMSAVRARYDIFGCVCIALVSGLAGGITRDLLLQNYGIYAFQHPELLLACAAAGVIVFFFGKLATYLDPLIRLLDNLSVGLWAVISVGKGLSAGLGIVPSIILGTVTSVGGGILRDVLMNRHPDAFQAGSMYGTAALIGSIVFALMKQHHILEQWAAPACFVIILVLRYASLLFHWHTKPPRDYSDAVTHAVAKPVKTVVRPVRSAVRRVRPPKGKVARDRENRAYEALRKIWRSPGETSPLPRLKPRGEEVAASGSAPVAAEETPAEGSGAAGEAAGIARAATDAPAAKATGTAEGSKAASPIDPRARFRVDRTTLNQVLHRPQKQAETKEAAMATPEPPDPNPEEEAPAPSN